MSARRFSFQGRTCLGWTWWRSPRCDLRRLWFHCHHQASWPLPAAFLYLPFLPLMERGSMEGIWNTAVYASSSMASGYKWSSGSATLLWIWQSRGGNSIVLGLDLVSSLGSFCVTWSRGIIFFSLLKFEMHEVQHLKFHSAWWHFTQMCITTPGADQGLKYPLPRRSPSWPSLSVATPRVTTILSPSVSFACFWTSRGGYLIKPLWASIYF